MDRSQLAGIAALLMCVAASMQVVAWIGGSPVQRVFLTCLAATFAVLWWLAEKELYKTRAQQPDSLKGRTHEYP